MSERTKRGYELVLENARALAKREGVAVAVVRLPGPGGGGIGTCLVSELARYPGCVVIDRVQPPGKGPDDAA